MKMVKIIMSMFDIFIMSVFCTLRKIDSIIKRRIYQVLSFCTKARMDQLIASHFVSNKIGTKFASTILNTEINRKLPLFRSKELNEEETS